VRILVWLVLLLVSAALFHLNRIGLPEQVKRRVVAQLARQGWDLEFSRLRWRWDRGIVAEDVHLQKREASGGPCVFLSEARCLIDYHALFRATLQINGLALREGRLFWIFQSTNLPTRTFQLDEVEGELLFHPDDRWELVGLRAQGLGAHFLFNGEVSHVSAMRHWNLSRLPVEPLPSDPTRPPVDPAARWHHIFEQARQVRLTGVPQVSCEFGGDGRDLHSFHARVQVQTAAVDSPWGGGTNVHLAIQLFPRREGRDPVQMEVNVAADRVTTPWGQAASVKIYGNGEPSYERWMPTNVHWAVEVHGGKTRWAESSFAVVMARSVANATNAQARLTECTLQAENLSTPWGAMSQGQVEATLNHPDHDLFPAQWTARGRLRGATSRWGEAAVVSLRGDGGIQANPWAGAPPENWPDRFQALRVNLDLGITNASTRDLDLAGVGVNLLWEAPHLQVQAAGRLAGGPLDLHASLDTDSRLVSFQADSRLNPAGIQSLLTTNAQSWLDRYEWTEPPHVEAEGSLQLPPWTQRQVSWRTDVRPTVVLHGRLETGPGSYRDVEFLSASTAFDMRKERWQLRGLKVQRREGTLEGNYVSLLTTRDFQWDVRARVFPGAARPLLATAKQQRIFDHVRFLEPPDVEAKVWGNWRDKTRIAMDANIRATNILVRGESITGLTARVVLTNQLLHIYNPQMRRAGRETASADGVMIDLATRKLHLTNAIGYVQAGPVSRMISPAAARTLAPFIMEGPVNAQVQGVVDLLPKRKEYDLRFDVSGSDLKWKLFDFGRFTSRIFWQGQQLVLTNAAAQFHDGQALGDAHFDFSTPPGSDFGFEVILTNVNFHTMSQSISGNTNHLEGRLSGELRVDRADTADWDSWQGGGEVLLEDGLIWDIPVFGMFSPVFNAVVPGLGNSRARRAAASFAITNSIIYTDNLEVSATAMRMKFKGHSDFHQTIDGRMEAELLRDTPGVGILISRVFWPMTKLFEYRVTGTLREPRREPLYIIPKILLLPFNPVKGWKEIFQLEE